MLACCASEETKLDGYSVKENRAFIIICAAKYKAAEWRLNDVKSGNLLEGIAAFLIAEMRKDGNILFWLRVILQ